MPAFAESAAPLAIATMRSCVRAVGRIPANDQKPGGSVAVVVADRGLADANHAQQLRNVGHSAHESLLTTYCDVWPRRFRRASARKLTRMQFIVCNCRCAAIGNIAANGEHRRQLRRFEHAHDRLATSSGARAVAYGHSRQGAADCCQGPAGKLTPSRETVLQLTERPVRGQHVAELEAGGRRWFKRPMGSNHKRRSLCFRRFGPRNYFVKVKPQQRADFLEGQNLAARVCLALRHPGVNGVNFDLPILSELLWRHQLRDREHLERLRGNLVRLRLFSHFDRRGVLDVLFALRFGFTAVFVFAGRPGFRT